jgi:hypothetical protein
LLLWWEDDDLGCVAEIDRFGDLLDQKYGYSVEKWGIPTDRSYRELSDKVRQFESESRGKDDLLLVYYGGHGEASENGRAIWHR